MRETGTGTGNLLGAFVLLGALGAFAGIACSEAPDGEEGQATESVPQAIGGGSCRAFDSQGRPNPDWPQCRGHDGPSIPGPSCAGLGYCYCSCRVRHNCSRTPSQCQPLASCLNECDRRSPNCTAPPPPSRYPDEIIDCL